MDDDRPHTLSGAYAVHALPAAERALFERHLAWCASCVSEVRALREAAARLAGVAAVPPPAALRARVLTAAAIGPPPLDNPAGRSAQASTGTTGTRAAPGTPGAEVTREAGPASPGKAGEAVPSASRGETGGIVARASRWRDGEVVARASRWRDGEVVASASENGERGGTTARWRARVMAGVAAASVAAAVAFGVVAWDARRDLRELRARDGEVMAVLSAPDARTVRRPVTSGGTATVVLSRARGRLVFTPSGLPPLPRAKVYELWLMGRDGVRPAGLLDGAGRPSPVLARTESGDERIGLTVEPSGGSGHPTTAPVLLADLPSA
ncbi:anti-sigma factor [Nonomuraea sp. NPDC000554]|uniref:anti-sigma factor n=1 Tax=Nonomuraea sp. NPDC000554 TaxID=3154259 RepID=UPI003331483B